MIDIEKRKQLELVRGSSAYKAMLTDVDIAGGHSFIFSSPDVLLSHSLCYLAAAGTVCDTSCLTCKRCAKVLGGNCLDITDFGQEKAMTEHIDKVLDGCSYAPYELPYKFYFLNFSERNDSVQNKLLKTLEEPPSAAKFIIITSSLSSILPTVKSRCAVFEPSLTEAELLGYEDDDNPNISYAKYAARGSLTEFFELASGKNVENFLSALNIARGIGKSSDMVRLLKYLPVGGSGVRAKLKKTLGYLELIYGDVMKTHGGVRVKTLGLYDIDALTARLAFGGMSESLAAIRRAVRRCEGGNLTSVADELILKLTEINYNAGAANAQ